MNFEELQVIWDTQNRQPIYVVNDAALQALLHQQRQDSRRRWFRRMVLPGNLSAAVLGMYIFWIGMAVEWLRDDGVPSWRSTTLWVMAAATLLFFVTSRRADRQQQERREEVPTGSFREETERGIAHLDYQIRARKNAVWAELPLGLAAFLALWSSLESAGSSKSMLALVGAMMVLGTLLDIRRHRRQVRLDLLPRKLALQALRARLENPQAPFDRESADQPPP